MGDRFTMKDLWFFIKSNMKYILSFAMLFLLLVVSYVFFMNKTEIDSDRQEEVEIPEATFDYTLSEVYELLLDDEELSGREQTAVTEVLENNMVFFRVYIENEDHTIFNKRHLLKEVLIHNDFTNLINLNDLGIYEELLENFIHVDLDTDTGIFSVEFTTGDEELNFDLANAYYTAMDTEDIEFLADRDLFFFDEPRTMTSSEETENVVEETDEEPIDVMNIIILILGGLIFGLAFGFLGAILISIFRKKIPMIYNLSLDTMDKVINLTGLRASSEQSEDVMAAISYPPNIKRVVLLEDTEHIGSLKEQLISENVDFYHHFSKIKPHEILEEIVLVVKINETTKSWYENQLTLIKGNKIPLKVIKI